MTVKNAFVCSIHEVIYPHDKALRCYVKIFIVKSLKARKSSLLDKGLACRDHRKVFIQKCPFNVLIKVHFNESIDFLILCRLKFQ